jgi:4a-hydroxytetrahydrobiopterin dehydratase
MMAAVNASCGRKGHIDMNNPLDRAAIIASLETEQGWQLTSEDESLQIIEKTYIFKDFNAAFGFMGRVALMAERANHHPEFHNRYRQVTIRWATHSCGGVTALDLEMAKICDQLAVDSGLKA